MSYTRGILYIGIISFLGLGFIFLSPIHVTYAKTLEELREELNTKRQTLKQAEDKIKTFQEKIKSKRQEAQTLSGQLEILDDNIEEIELNVAKTNDQIETTNTEIEEVQVDIDQKEAEINKQKDILAEYIRSIHDLDQQSTVTIFLKYQTFSEAMNETSTISELQNRAQETLTTIQRLHEDLLTRRRELEDYRQSLAALKLRQQAQQSALQSQHQSKERLLQLTNAQESQYSALLKESQQAHKEAEAEISSLDQAIREELKKQGFGDLPSIGVLDWPIQPIFGISCPFHCSGYPFAYLIGPHTGTDIPTYVGTPIKAPADGYVGRLHDSGGRGYSYILLLHGNNVSTVYGHVSGFGNIKEGEVVTRGTVIGYTGGAPGSHGAGLSSGPHLHFEVRVNNIPTDAQKYLPSL